MVCLARLRPGRTISRAWSYTIVKVGVAILALLLLISFIGPYVTPYGVSAVEGLPLAEPSAAHPFGLDYLGRDVLSRFLAGGRSVVLLSVIATVLGVGVGLVIGLVAGYRRDWVDGLLMRIADIVVAFPAIILVLVLVAGVGSKLWLVVLAVAATHVPRVARVVRGAAAEVAVREYVEAAEARGESTPRILTGEVLPNIWPPVLVDFGVRLTYSIILIASLSFLGFGLQPPAADWGVMINENRSALSVQPFAILYPVLAIALLTIAVNLIVDGLGRAMGRGTVGLESGVRSGVGG